MVIPILLIESTLMLLHWAVSEGVDAGSFWTLIRSFGICAEMRNVALGVTLGTFPLPGFVDISVSAVLARVKSRTTGRLVDSAAFVERTQRFLSPG